MRIELKFEKFASVKEFNRLATLLEGDVFLKSGRYVVDAKSLLGVLSLSLDKPVDLEIISKNEQEVNDFISQLRELGIYRD